MCSWICGSLNSIEAYLYIQVDSEVRRDKNTITYNGNNGISTVHSTGPNSIEYVEFLIILFWAQQTNAAVNH